MLVEPLEAEVVVAVPVPVPEEERVPDFEVEVDDSSAYKVEAVI